MVLSEQSHYAQKVQSNNMDYRNDYSAAKAMSDSISAMENSRMIGNTTANDAVCNDEVEINKENRMDKENMMSAGISHPAANTANKYYTGEPIIRFKRISGKDFIDAVCHLIHDNHYYKEVLNEKDYDDGMRSYKLSLWAKSMEKKITLIEEFVENKGRVSRFIKQLKEDNQEDCARILLESSYEVVEKAKELLTV